jgi:hypothetical protein
METHSMPDLKRQFRLPYSEGFLDLESSCFDVFDCMFVAL